MTSELWSTNQLADAIGTLLARAERDEALRAELAAQQENIYSALGDPSLRDYFGVIEAAVNAHVALSDAMHEYGKWMAIAMAASRTFVGPFASLPQRGSHTLNPGLDHARGGSGRLKAPLRTSTKLWATWTRVAFF